MIANNLIIGAQIKNYRALCDILHEDRKTGNAKKSQLKEWSRYFEWERNGNKYIITDVYDKPKPKTDERKKGNNSVYVQYIEVLLLSFLATKKRNTYSLTRRTWWKVLGMVSKKYRYGNQEEKNELKKLDSTITNYEVNAFYSNTSKKLTDIFQSALKSLENRRLIDYREELVIQDDDGYGYGEAEEMRKIQNIERKVLEEFGLDKISDVFTKFLQEDYYSRVNELLYEELGFKRYFKQIEIIYVHENIIAALPKIERDLQTQLLNMAVMRGLTKNTVSIYNNQLRKYKLGATTWCPPDNFLYAQDLLMNELVKVNKFDEQRDVYDINFEEEELKELFN